MEPEFNRVYLIQGNVRTEEGGRLPAPAVIERVCAGSVVREGNTDAGGRFSLQVGRNLATTQDASTDATLVQKGPVAPPMLMSAPSIVGCEIRAALPGYRSNSVALADKLHSLTIDVGTLVLHPMAPAEGVTVSATSLSAPKDARKAVESGRKKAEKDDYAAAIADFKRAVELHPAYAEAWFLLGEAQARAQDLDSAGGSFRRAIAADARYVPPYMGLAQIAASRMAWADLAENTDRILALDPSSSALAYFYSAVANYNLDRLGVAEQRALRAEQLDAQHRLPRVQLLLVEILVGRKDYAAAAERLRTFLRWAPNGKDADAARRRLAGLQNDSAPTKPQDE